MKTIKEKHKLLILDYIILPLSGISLVVYLTNSKYNVEYILYENNFIIIDYWFFIHVFNTNFIVLLYPFNLNLFKFWYIIFGWEFIENILIPSLFINLYYFREDNKDTFGDIIAAIPASFYLYYKNNFTYNYKKMEHIKLI